MRRIPATSDTARLGTFQSVEVRRKIADIKTGVQAVTNEGVPRWIVVALYKAPTSKGGFESKATLEEINIANEKEPVIAPLAAIEFENLSGSYWTTRNERGESISGISLSADAVTVVKGIQRQTEAV